MTEQLQLIDVGDITPAEWNRDIGDVGELAESIKDIGLIEPIVVRKVDGNGTYELVAGERRLTAAKAAGLSEIPTIVRDYDDRQALEAQLVENLHRKDLEPLEEAHGYQRLLELGVKQAEIAHKVKRSPAHVSKRLGLLELNDVARKALSDGTITVEDAAALRKLKDMPKITTAALNLGKQWGNMTRAIDHVLREHEAARKRGLIEHDLKQKNVPIVKRPDYSDKARPLGKTQYRSIGITTAQHRKEPCHAAYIDTFNIKAVYVCTDPSRHTAKGASSVKVPKGTKIETATSSKKNSAQKRETFKRKELKEAAALRATVASRLLAPRTLKAAEAFELVADVVIERVWRDRDAQLVVARLLDLSKEQVDELQEQGWETNRNALQVVADKSPDDLRRVAIACAIAATEVELSSYWHFDWRGDARYFAFLENAGHTRTDIEERRLAGEEKD